MDSWEGLDIDESDVMSFIQRCNSNTEFIPGPAGNAQALMLNRESEEPKNTQQLMREIAAAGDARDFNSNAWKWARRFVEYHGLVAEGDIKNLILLSSRKSMEKIPLVVCVVKECHSNGLGDISIVIKDPSTTAKASVHRKAVMDPEFGSHIAVGASLILKNVSCFGHNPWVPPYLNITVCNIVKVFKNDISPPTDHEVEASMPVVRNYPGEYLDVDDILKKLVPPPKVVITGYHEDTSVAGSSSLLCSNATISLGADSPHGNYDANPDGATTFDVECPDA
ncbi:hypothetical protein DEO72_LG10g1676 [Vigna unguiculata]|uniref:Homologous recombination OB-fold protein OB-fold domain-containing protein n=1 Tax=Vigna unguiculata TaxID=3917 RepID=A0A4D6N9N7_VIGUN|nr:hypothetical protein DEO72_LG10g1676 [Vigna unguiculata]